MRLRALAYGLVRLACAAAWIGTTSTAVASDTTTTTTTTSNATHIPLFPVGEGALQTLHLSLASLLPVLPHLAPGPDHTLAVTLATPAFKPLLYNWLCFLRYKAKWGQRAPDNVHGDPNSEGGDPFPDTPKVLVVTSDEELALELSENGVVTWLVLGIDWEAFDEAELMDDEDPLKGEALDQVQRMMSDDLFTNLRLLDLLLPPERPADVDPDSDTDEPIPIHQLIPWGTLRYQSLMLERTAVMSALVGALVESQRSEATWRREQDAYWRARVLEHDWESGPLDMPKFCGVKGVLLVDNDAVWLSNPTPFLSHYYRPTGPHPAVIYAPDMAPSTKNAWGTHTMPCACFFYTRVSDVGAQQAAPVYPDPRSPLPLDPYLYSPSEGAAATWRNTALCHISMLLQAVEVGQRQARERGAVSSEMGEDPFNLAAPQMAGARAPSFQATSLGPALFLSEQVAIDMPEISHEHFLDALGSADVDDLHFLLEIAGLAPDPYTGEVPKSCLAQAQEFQYMTPAKIPTGWHEPPTSLTLQYYDMLGAAGPRPHTPIRVEPLPFDLFPPGMRYFDGGLDPGTKPCVVHANYATGSRKEELLRSRGLWALVRPEETDLGKWTCDVKVMREA
ncbi:hypothetical protein JCM10908_007386 [Rhodotorula pacifica]|uniref:uncharacterized protein n=1 Tax=Rhodotorula pacifica TaxID=1495444 RepID=UPI003178556B